MKENMYFYRENEDGKTVSVYRLATMESWMNGINTYCVCGMEKISGDGDDWESVCAYIMTESVTEGLNANEFYKIDESQYDFYGIKED